MSLEDPATWRPVESALDLWNERSFLAGILIGAVAYGVHATLFFTTLNLLFKRPRATWADYSWITYVIVLFLISSIANWGQFTQMIWIDNRNYPGGPSAYLVEQQTEFAAKLVVGGYMVNGWLQDGLIVYRFWVIFRNYAAIIIPFLLFLGTVATSTWLMVIIDGTSYFEGTGAALLIAYYALSVALNVLATVAISIRLWIARRRMRTISSGIASSYISISAILIESAFLYTVCGIAFLVPFGLADPSQNIILPTLAQVESIAPLLIIMRVAQGRAWSAETTTQYDRSTFSSSGARHRRGISSGHDAERGQTESVALSGLRNGPVGSHDLDKTALAGSYGEPIFQVVKH
ncbi:hypothetical protein AURDEDRAFT_159970 [Auricularia subglabra TFB-10046 SS5]|nr:hypothetical protein AURDEDRAFT_159970 [Auricularia subglabra TFB-10046 SS5]